MSTSGFAPGDDEKVIEILRKWDGGGLSNELYAVLAQILPQPIVEVVILRGRVLDGVDFYETLVLPRPPGDPTWLEMLHTPGQALRRSDFERYNWPVMGPFERIQERELGFGFSDVPDFVGLHHRVGARGAEVAQVFLAEVADDVLLPLGAMWMNVKQLRSEPRFIQHQVPHIMMALEAYKAGRV